ncbi:MAG: type VI secretion system protein TssA [Planctomycetota bacterium]
MATPSVLDIDLLLQPIPGDRPVGEDLRQDLATNPAYYQIKDLRTAARSAERQGEFEPVIGLTEAAAWRPIVDAATEALTSRTKDLEIIAWMIEALARTHGFAGVRDGLRLARETVARFWDQVYPTPDEDGIETRVAPLTGLNGAGADGTLIAPISRIPLTRSKDAAPIAAWSCGQAAELERLPADARSARVEAGAITSELIAAAVNETDPKQLLDVLQDIEGAMAELQALSKELDAKCGSDAPPVSAIRDALTAARDSLRHVAGARLPVEAEAAGEDVAAASGSADAQGAAAPAARKSGSGEINTREDALRALTSLADYFKRTEPHSPLSFLLQRTIRWARLPLPDLLAELIPDSGARATFEMLTGVPTPSASQ